MSEHQRPEPIHFTQAYGLTLDEAAIDFFDLNLLYDSRLFLDPFLLRRSLVEDEQLLFDRFGDFFRFAYDQALLVGSEEDAYDKLKNLLNFHEPKEIGLGYTEHSHDGAGLGPAFAKLLLEFFIGNSARRLVKEEGLYPNGRFNPITLQLFIDDLGPDGLSDITANIVMDYLIAYTQDQCKIHGIPLKQLPLQQDGFNFEEMEWKGGGYYDLPENLTKPGQAVVLVPKRFLRATEEAGDNIESKVRGILQHDPQLTERFSSFLHKKISEISTADIREVFLQEGSVFRSYLESLYQTRTEPYNFERDIYKILAIKSYASFFEDKEFPLEVNGCDQLLELTLEFVTIFKDQCAAADGWREMWKLNENGDPARPQNEKVSGRIFRGMGMAYFHHLGGVTFEAEVGTGNGPVDFKVVYLDCRIVIELKKLSNASLKGDPPLPGYIHGVKRQLPDYAYLSRATHAIYITGQHYTTRKDRKSVV